MTSLSTADRNSLYVKTEMQMWCNNKENLCELPK